MSIQSSAVSFAPTSFPESKTMSSEDTVVSSDLLKTTEEKCRTTAEKELTKIQ